jgi:hypothetical protein
MNGLRKRSNQSRLTICLRPGASYDRRHRYVSDRPGYVPCAVLLGDVMNREDQQRHLECLEAELADMRAKARQIEQDRDIISAWLEGYDLGYAAVVEASRNIQYYTYGEVSGQEMLRAAAANMTPMRDEEVRAALSEIDKQLDEGGMP